MTADHGEPSVQGRRLAPIVGYHRALKLGDGTAGRDVEGFKASLQQAEPPDGLNPALQAPSASRRAAGEAGNAGYWYRHAGRPRSQARLDAEWEQIASALLAARR